MSALRGHSEWLGLVDHSGPFISLPVLKRVFPQGLDGLNKDVSRAVRKTYREWSEVSKVEDKTAADTNWTRYVLTSVLNYPTELLAEGPAIPAAVSARVPEFHEVIRPDLILVNPQGREGAGQPRILIQAYSRETNLEKTLPDKPWKETPAGRMTFLLRATGVKLGLVTNGEHWMLVYAPVGETSSTATWQSALWLEEPTTLQAFVAVLGTRRILGVADTEILEALLADSADYQQEVTEQLGLQVRRSIEILVQQLDRANRERQGKLLLGVAESEVYEASVTFMMRLVFLFFAEENRLLPIDDELYQSFYAASTIREQLRELADKSGEELLERQADAYPRLLATFRGVHGGIEHDNLMIPPYGGHLFDPDRFPFLEGRLKGSSWRVDRAKPLPIHNRTVLHLLEALQTLEDRKLREKRRLSFRSLDIEQIGHVYEGLLDHTVRKAHSPVVSLKTSGKLEGDEPEVSIAQLAEWKESGEATFIEKIGEITELSEKSVQNNLAQRISPEDQQRLSISCNNDSELIDEVIKFLGLVRRDTTDLPVVVPAGGFYVTSGTDRRSTGTHYTQRSLTEPIVQHTLEPLVYVGVAEGAERENWKLKSPKELLELKICDLACGSGAFLVQACRYLSQRLVEAWAEIEEGKPGEFIISPDGDTAKVVPISSYIPRNADERLILARRLVVERCLYGVDRNHLAVEMAKLSLWLITLDKNRPFTFLDHHIKCGDSLIGVTSIAQLEYFSLDADSDPWIKQRNSSIQGVARASVASATALYKEIGETPVLEIRDSERKEKILRDAESATAELRVLADLLVGTTMAAGEVRGDKFFERANVYYGQFCDVFEKKIQGEKRAVAMARLRAVAQALLDEQAPESQKPRSPFHWALEYPEVFETRNGFDAIVGNPPYMGGQKITGALGQDYRMYLLDQLVDGQRGSADLCVYFLIRAIRLIGANGFAGLVVTSALAEGNSREIGLERLVAEGLIIFRSGAVEAWVGSANVTYRTVWLCSAEWRGKVLLDDEPVSRISPALKGDCGAHRIPFRLQANANISFQGSIVLGKGFVIDAVEARRLLAESPINKDVVFPYLVGQEINADPDHKGNRWVINFHDWPVERAMKYESCFRIIENRVKPERQRLKPNGGYVLRKPLPQKWWIYGEKRPALYAAIKDLKWCMAIATQATKYVAFATVQMPTVFSHALSIIASDSYGLFAVLSSDLHEIWAREYGSKNLLLLRYAPTDLLETFPLLLDYRCLEKNGESYHNLRKTIMVKSQIGLTEIYNLLHDPSKNSSEINSFRDIRRALTKAVIEAYGWSDINPEYDFHETPQGLRFTVSNEIRSELLYRLLELNHQRHSDENEADLLSDTTAKGSKRASKKPTSLNADIRQTELFLLSKQ